jgi:phosphonate transport system substrate-binding protein
VLAKSRSDIEAFAAKTKNGSATYQSVVIGNVSKNINSISDMRGKNIAYGDQASTSSHMIPKSILVDNGLKPGNDYQEHFLGSHDAVAVAVQNGTADAGGLSKPIFESLVKRGIIDANKVRVITESKPFPQYPWAMRSDLDSGLKEKIKQTFYNLKDKEILKPMKADGLAPIADADYNVVRNLKKSLNL